MPITFPEVNANQNQRHRRNHDRERGFRCGFDIEMIIGIIVKMNKDMVMS